MKSKIMTRLPLALLTLFSVLIAIISLRYFSFERTDILTDKPDWIYSNPLWQAGFYLHVAFGAIALLIGGFQFFGSLRDRFTALHRTFGKIYVASVFVSSIAGLGIAVFTAGGIFAKTGFAALAIAWMYSNFRAYTAIRRVDITEHRNWMIRNFSLTFAAVTLRIWLPLFLAGFGIKFGTAYPIIAWLCWVPNLIVAELMVRRSTAKAVLSPAPEQAAA
ncbi:MAG: DUF2306 domain-containing protein [Chloracidobacterium sp.]|nr:DUF2306 domain-containing protein [Chloracidobacterium sp.]